MEISSRRPRPFLHHLSLDFIGLIQFPFSKIRAFSFIRLGYQSNSSARIIERTYCFFCKSTLISSLRSRDMPIVYDSQREGWKISLFAVSVYECCLSFYRGTFEERLQFSNFWNSCSPQSSDKLVLLKMKNSV